jgi:signal transduction histidine kinase
VAGWHRTRGNAWLKAGLLGLFLLSIAASSLSFRLGRPIYLTAWLGLANVFAVGYALFYMGAALRRPQPYQRLVAAAGALNVLIGVRDWVVIRISGDYADSTWIRYSSVLFGLALGYIVLHRFREARAQAQNLMATLQQRVDAREQELAASYRQLEALAREQERARERTTIMRDLHDGVGAHISSAIRQLQTGRADNAVVLQTLRESLDQLKLSVDAMNTPPGDVAGLLASLRYRLEPRFASSDIELQWMVDALEPVQRLDAPAMRHLQFLLFEALPNVLQHARATTLGIQATQAGGITRLRVVDNGRGFDAATAGSNGLRTMRDRAAALGAQLAVTSEPGRTCVELGIPH